MRIEKVYCDECNVELTDENRATNPLQVETRGYLVTVSIKDLNTPHRSVDLCRKCFAFILAAAVKEAGKRR